MHILHFQVELQGFVGQPLAVGRFRVPELSETLELPTDGLEPDLLTDPDS